MESKTLVPKRVKLQELHLDLDNLRGHGEEEIDLLVKSLTIFGQFKPIYVDEKTMTVKIGNGRLMAMRKMGWTECDCILLDWNENSGMEVADNRINELSDWESKPLNEWIKKKQAEWWGFDQKMSKKAESLVKKESRKEEMEKENGGEKEVSEKDAIPLCPCCGNPLEKKKRVILD